MTDDHIGLDKVSYRCRFNCEKCVRFCIDQSIESVLNGQSNPKKFRLICILISKFNFNIYEDFKGWLFKLCFVSDIFIKLKFIRKLFSND